MIHLIQSDNPEYFVSWYVSGPMDARLKDLYCISFLSHACHMPHSSYTP